jgi:hypothetical protein
LSDSAPPFQPAGSAGEDKLGFDVEFILQLVLPLLGKLRRAQHCKPCRFPAVKEFFRNKGSLDSLSNANIVSNQDSDGIMPQCHE